MTSPAASSDSTVSLPLTLSNPFSTDSSRSEPSASAVSSRPCALPSSPAIVSSRQSGGMYAENIRKIRMRKAAAAERRMEMKAREAAEAKKKKMENNNEVKEDEEIKKSSSNGHTA